MSSTSWNPNPPDILKHLPGRPSKSCPACGHETANADDKYCRKCGIRILMVCSHCQKSVRSDDMFCAHCGHKRWKLYELWRYGMLHRSPLFVLGTIVVTGGAWLALYFLLNKTRRRSLR